VQSKNGSAYSAQSERSLRAVMSRHPLALAVIAGLVATHIATITGYWYHGIGLPNMDWNRANGHQLLPHGSDQAQFVSGAIFHYATGVCFALLYAFKIQPALPWRDTALGNTLKAVVFGLGMAVISALIIVPLVFFPQLHPGFFSLNLGIKVVLAIFLWHLIYGLHLGAIYNPLPQPDAARERAMVSNIHERDGLDVLVTGGETVASLS
jgi:hypothetical protein